MLLVFAASRVNCGVFSMAVEERIDNFRGERRKYFSPSLCHANPKFCTNTDHLQFNSSGHKCLQAGTKLEIGVVDFFLPVDKFKFHVSYDSGKHSPYDKFEEKSKFSKKEKVCFLFGYYQPGFSIKPRSISFYVNFLSEETPLGYNDLIRFSIDISGNFIISTLDKRLVKNVDPVDSQGGMDERIELKDTCDNDSVLEDIKFTFQSQKFVFQDIGVFKIVFVDNDVKDARKKGLAQVVSTKQPAIDCNGVSVKLKVPDQKFKKRMNVIV